MYESVGFSLSDSQISKLRRGKQSGVPVTLSLARSQVGGQHDLYLTKSQINKLNKASGSVQIKFSKTQVRAQRGGFLGAVLNAARAFLPKLLPVLGTLGLSAASGAISGATHKAASGKGLERAGGKLGIYFDKKDIGDMIGLTKRLEEKGLLPAGTCEECKNSIRRQEGGFIGALLATLAGSLLPGLLGGKGLQRAGKGLRRAGLPKN